MTLNTFEKRFKEKYNNASGWVIDFKFTIKDAINHADEITKIVRANTPEDTSARILIEDENKVFIEIVKD